MAHQLTLAQIPSAQKARARRKGGVGGIPPRPSRKRSVRNQCQDFREKKFGFRSGCGASSKLKSFSEKFLRATQSVAHCFAGISSTFLFRKVRFEPNIFWRTINNFYGRRKRTAKRNKRKAGKRGA